MSGPVYLIASERSGTNLLRRRLTESQSEILGASPAHFLKHLYFYEPYYGDLADDAAFKAMIADALGLCYEHFAPWDLPMSVEEVLAGHANRPRTAIHLSDFLLTRYASHKGYGTYFCKDNFLYEFALDIAHSLPESRFVYLYRDPRDFVVSQLKRPRTIRSIANYANLWSYEQVRSIKVATRLRADGRCYWLSYERLVSEEGAVIDDLLRFLGVARGDAGTAAADNVVVPVAEWSNLDKPTLTANYGKYRKEMSRLAVALVERICAKPMRHLGYATDSGASAPAILAYRAFDGVRGALSRVWRRAAVSRYRRNPSLAARARRTRKCHVNYRNAGA